MLGASNSDLPDTVDVTREDIENNFDVWVYYHAFGGRFLPSQLKKEDKVELDVIITIESILQILELQDREQENGNR